MPSQARELAARGSRMLGVRGRKGEESVLEEVRKRIDDSARRPERRALYQTAFVALAYFAGQQHVVAERGTIRRARLPRSRRRKLYKVNKIQPAVMRAVAKIDGLNVVARVAPKTGAHSDREAARLADKVREHVEDVTDWQSKRLRALMWAAITGTAFTRHTWDPEAGVARRAWYVSKEAKRRNQPTIGMGPEERARAERDGLYEDTFSGEIACDVFSIFNFHWDWTARDGGIDDCEWVATHELKLRDALIDEFGSKAREAAVEEASEGAFLFQEAIANMTSTNELHPLGSFRPEDLRGELVATTEMWQRPSKRHPRGRRAIIAGGVVLVDGENPYCATGHPLPFVKWDWVPQPGRFMANSLADQLREPQRALNRSRSVQQDVLQNHGYPLTFIQSGSGLKRADMHSFPGVIFEVNGPQVLSAMKFTSPPDLPPWMRELPVMAENEIRDISAQHSLADSPLPGQVRSGAGIRLLQEQQDQVLSPTAKSHARSVARMGSMVLAIAGTYYDRPQVARILGPDGQFEVFQFTGADLRGHSDVRIFPESARLTSSAAEVATVFDLVELGALDMQDPADRSLVISAVMSRTADNVQIDRTLDERQEEQSIRRMIENPGFQAKPRPWDNHEIRIKVLERFLKSPDFERAAQPSQEAIVALWQARVQELARRFQEQLAAAEAQRGAPGQRGEPSQPRNTPRAVA